MKNLIIVESPTKAKTIKNFLGKNYTVIASKGHIRDLPKSSFGIKIENGEFKPEYRIARENAEIVKEIKKLAKNSDEIYIATDEDREGEAIGFHIAKAIGKDPLELPRIVFHEITKTAILNSLKNPRKINIDSFNAQQARRLLDRIVGYKLSPLISSKIQKGLSAGRVQSASLKLIVDREREINAFKAVEYWSLDTLFNNEIEAILVEFNGEKIDKLTISTQLEAKNIENLLDKEKFLVENIEKKDKITSTPPPFITSTLQQTSSNLLGFSPKKTMMLAQILYEGVKTNNGVSGVITYMRTDSLNVSKEAIDTLRNMILKEYGEEYLSKQVKEYKTKVKLAQEAHEAIRPTNLDFTPNKAIEYLKEDEYKLYKLIYNRFVSTQMTDAVYESQSIIFKSNSSRFKANGRRLKFDGFYKVWENQTKDKLLPNLKENEPISLNKLEANQHFTEPPARYSESSLIKQLEALGIGRPSTYAPTISILVARNYIEIDKKRIIPTEIAFKVIDVCEKNFPEIVDSSFTFNMEESLDLIASNQKNWQIVLKDFYEPFIKQIQEGKQNIQSQKIAIPTGEMCPECGSELVMRKGRFGEFIACSNFPTCKHTKNLKDKIIKKEPVKKIDISCPECGSDLVERSSKRGKFFGCSNYPKCKFTANTLEEIQKAALKEKK